MTPRNPATTAKNGPSRPDDARPGSPGAGASTEPLTAEERAAHRIRHHLVVDDYAGADYCPIEGDPWPCATIRLLDEVDEARAAIERAGP